MKKFLFSLFISCLCGTSANAAVALTYSGGNGTPLSVSLASPAEYVVTTTNTNSPFFVFDGTGGVFTLTGTTVSGSITYRIDGGPAQTLNRLGSGRAANDVTADDSYLFSATLPGVTAGDTVILMSGTLTTTANFAGAAPANGSFDSFIATQNGTRISAFATAVPEPGTIALTLLASGGAAVMAFRRRRK